MLSFLWLGRLEEAPGQAQDGGLEPLAAVAATALRGFLEAERRYQNESQNNEAKWQFARACFDLGEYATNRAQRAEIAERGIGVCRELLAQEPDSAPGHYYLGMNLGQLARTKSLGALKLVDQMEREFSRARELKEGLDYAGPDRNLGLLYLEAPVIGSIGSRTKAREHLERAVELAPVYPENPLNLIEAFLKWGQKDEARRHLKRLEDQWPEARKMFAGESWARSWMDWEQRLEKARKKTGGSPNAVETPRRKEQVSPDPREGRPLAKTVGGGRGLVTDGV